MKAVKINFEWMTFLENLKDLIEDLNDDSNVNIISSDGNEGIKNMRRGV
jgi:hypothetical protein